VDCLARGATPPARYAIFALHLIDPEEWRNLCAEHFWRWITGYRSDLEWGVVSGTESWEVQL
jgi:hypothetical protein